MPDEPKKLFGLIGINGARFFAFFLLLGFCSWVGYFLRFDPLICSFLIIPGLILAIILISHLLLGWIPRWRPYFRKVAVACGVPFLCVVCFTSVDLHFWSRDEKIAKDYVTTIKSSLEDFRHLKGSYPTSLEEVKTLPQRPYRLSYSGSHDGYEFVYDGCCLYSSGTGEWFDDD